MLLKKKEYYPPKDASEHSEHNSDNEEKESTKDESEKEGSEKAESEKAESEKPGKVIEKNNKQIYYRISVCLWITE